MKQLVISKTNRTVVIVVKLSEHLGHGNTKCKDNFYNSPKFALFMKSK
jgi:ribosomal protein S24E